MYAKAIEKLESEIEQNKNDSYVQVVGNFLLGHLKANPDDAEKIATEDKTIKKSLEEMRKIAEKKKVGNYAMFTPEEGFAIVLRYFSIESAVDITVPVATPQKPVETQKKSTVDFNVSLDDFM